MLPLGPEVKKNNTMKTTMTILIVIIMFLLIAKTKISFSPFEITMRDWRFAVGFFLILLGIGFIYRDAYRAGVTHAYNLLTAEHDETCDHQYTTVVISGSCEMEELVDRCSLCKKEKNHRTE